MSNLRIRDFNGTYLVKSQSGFVKQTQREKEYTIASRVSYLAEN